jgi:hypothetical protein
MLDEVFNNKSVTCGDCLGIVEEANGNFDLELCSSCNETFLKEESCQNMKEAVIKVKYDPSYLESENTNLKDEIQGWLQHSNMVVISTEEIK